MMPSDLIYRKDAKDYARHAIAKGLNVLEYLDEVPATIFRPAMCNQWVSVKGSYPPENGRYLVFYLLSTKPPIPWMRVLDFAEDLYEVDNLDFEDKKGKSGFYSCDHEYGYYEVDDVTHWMLLPEHPKEGET